MAGLHGTTTVSRVRVRTPAVQQNGKDDLMAGARAVRALVSGRVQGVGYRYFVVGAAQRLGVEGYARNLPDGRVEIWAEGPAGAVERFLQAAGRGPAFAAVRSVELEDREPRGTFEGFGVRFD